MRIQTLVWMGALTFYACSPVDSDSEMQTSNLKENKMRLREDVNAGLKEMFNHGDGGAYALDEFGRAEFRFTVTIDGHVPEQLPVRIGLRMGPANKSFTLSCVFKTLDDRPGTDGMLAALAANITPSGKGGGHLAIDDVTPSLVLVRHWSLPTIDVRQFRTVVVDFSAAAMDWTRQFATSQFRDERLGTLGSSQKMVDE